MTGIQCSMVKVHLEVVTDQPESDSQGLHEKFDNYFDYSLHYHPSAFGRGDKRLFDLRISFFYTVYLIGAH